MSASQTIILAMAASTLGVFAGAQQFYRRSALARLRAALGVPSGGKFAGLARALLWIGSRIPGGSDAGLQSALTRAGYFYPSALPFFVALRLICTATVFSAVLFQAQAIGATVLILAVFLAFFSSRLVVIVLKLLAEKRERLLRREMPALVDILMMVLNSGISIDQSLRYVTDMLEETAPLSTAVLKRYVTDVDNGTSFEAAFERMGQRLGINEGYDFANLIRQSLLQGGEIMTSLESFGTELADKRIAAAREQIGRRSVLLTLVMLAFFMPVLLITLGGPAVSRIMHTLNAVKHEIHHRGIRR